jgi:xylulokinase
MSVWIGIDNGTSACKVVAVDGDGRVVADSLHHYPLTTPRPGWAEQDPADWWRAADQGVRDVVAAVGDRPVRGFGLCGQMHGLTALDDDGQVLRSAILWNDQRSAPQCDEITERAGGLRGLLDLTQNRMLPGFTGGKLLWLRQHEPETYGRMRHMLNPKDYLRLRMTGDHVTEVSDASGTGLFDVRNRRWSTKLLELLDIPEELLPRVVESAEITGGLSAEVASRWGVPAGTPVVGGGGDAVIQTTSMGVIGEGVLGVTLGTAGIVGGASTSCPEPDGRLQISCGNASDRWHVMGVALTTGGAFQWLRNALRPLMPNADLDYPALVALARQAPAGSEGLLFLPYLLGERCPHLAPDARGSWVGLTSRHSAPHLSRSVLEGVLLNLREILAIFTGAGLSVDRVRASGGATVESLWLQLLADVLQIEVRTVTGAEEGGAFGAALLAGIGTGNWTSLEEATAVVQETGRTVPDTSVAGTYDALHGIHRQLYTALEPRFAELAVLDAS